MNNLIELLKVYNDFTCDEYYNDEMTLEEMIKENEIGLMYTQCDVEELDEWDINIQYSYNISEQAYKGYMDNELLFIDPCPIEKAIEEIRDYTFDDYYSYMVDKVYQRMGV